MTCDPNWVPIPYAVFMIVVVLLLVVIAVAALARD